MLVFCCLMVSEGTERLYETNGVYGNGCRETFSYSELSRQVGGASLFPLTTKRDSIVILNWTPSV